MSSDQDCVDSDISISCNYDEAEKEYQKFPGTSGCTNSGLNIKLNKGSCKAKLTIIEELDGEELSHSKTFEFEVI
jgi:hypothetical protein